MLLVPRKRTVTVSMLFALLATVAFADVLIVEEGFESGALLDISNPSGSTPEVIQTTTLVPANT